MRDVRWNRQSSMISEAATCSAVTFHRASSSATWKDPGQSEGMLAVGHQIDGAGYGDGTLA